MNLEQKERRTQSNIRVIYDLTMGLLWCGAGLFLLTYQYLGYEFGFDRLAASIFGIACIVYGGFRIWRGFKAKKGQ